MTRPHRELPLKVNFMRFEGRIQFALPTGRTITFIPSRLYNQWTVVTDGHQRCSVVERELAGPCDGPFLELILDFFKEWDDPTIDVFDQRLLAIEMYQYMTRALNERREKRQLGRSPMFAASMTTKYSLPDFHEWVDLPLDSR